MKKLKANLLLLIFLLAGCDFTSGLHKDILKAQDLITNRKFSKATRVYEDILKRKPTKTIQIKINYQLAEIYSIYLGNYKMALRHLNTIITSSNEPSWQVKALEKIGTIYFEEFKDFKKSKDVYKKLMGFTPRLSRQEFYLFKLAQSEFHLKNYEKAQVLFRELTPNNEFGAESYYYLGLGNFLSWQMGACYCPMV